MRLGCRVIMLVGTELYQATCKKLVFARRSRLHGAFMALLWDIHEVTFMERSWDSHTTMRLLSNFYVGTAMGLLWLDGTAMDHGTAIGLTWTAMGCHGTAMGLP